MLKILFKHTIIEFIINMMYNILLNNFNIVNPTDLAVGQLLREIKFIHTDNSYIVYTDMKITYINGCIIRFKTTYTTMYSCVCESIINTNTLSIGSGCDITTYLIDDILDYKL